MAKSKKTESKKIDTKKSQVAGTAKRFTELFTHRYLVIKSAASMLLLVIAFWLIRPAMHNSQIEFKIILLVYGLVLLVILGLLIGEYIIKIARIQKDNVNRYSLFVSINTLLGLSIPLWYFNYVSRSLIFLLKSFAKSDSWLCDLRGDIVRTYLQSHIYWQIDRIAFYTVLMAIILFIFGGLVERLISKK